MTNDTMQRIVLARRPQGAPVPEDFRLETLPIPQPGPGEVLVGVSHLSLDPYMRGRMDAGKSYAAAVELGQTMEGGAVGQVLASQAPDLAEGDWVFGPLGWASHAVLPGHALRRLDPGQAPVTTALGVLGMPGFTGWYGLTELGRPRTGETLVVAAATGPVGSMVGQLAKLRGLRVVGIAGGARKCRLAVEEFGFDACIDHKDAGGRARDARSIGAELEEACPDGIDIYFENVGGAVLQAVLGLMNPQGRIPLCGTIAWYDLGGMGRDGGTGPDMLPRAWRTILVNRLKVSGFIISDHWNRLPDFLAEVAPLVGSGQVRYREDIAKGLENAPAAFIAMLKGGNLGKQIVQIA
ncbi:NADP-dependent oxidoreductase [Frigidibacter sp. ROC022]|uniref:NADP-dependent oxidoreductase n=1 Tax=Frigidibacter sp. ROC022 TaxID=2971796 RepID=UPI00215B0988|nr:NADP-dependent oxidoreductase [Frigidibacter sp. ROC022]MCR8724088.1 NADP-dependent oxidoreductase [Frigidibacter sp. ROC022]